MNIAILSKADASGGGASRIAQELCFLLNEAGHTAHHFLALYQNQPHSLARPLYGHYFLRRVVGRLNRYGKFWGFPELIPWEVPALLWQRITSYDLIHFHDLSSAISPLTVRWLARRTPTVWTFHDCSPFTGGCLYPMSCPKYTTRCGGCPQLGLWPIDSRFDFTGLMQDVKRKTASENRFVPVTPSDWLATTAFGSGMFAAPPVVVPNGINTDIFQPADRSALKQKLGLSAQRPVILLTAVYIHEERKGLRFAIEALRRVKYLYPQVLIVGHLDPETETAFSELDYVSAGYVADDELKAQYFAAADVFLSCSLAESFSLVTAETMATATPSVSFASGAIPELITHNHSGYLVPPGDVDGLVQGLHTALTDNRVEAWGRQARLTVERRFTQQAMLQNYLDVYTAAIQRFSLK